jgi:hypothetical protein
MSIYLKNRFAYSIGIQYKKLLAKLGWENLIFRLIVHPLRTKLTLRY